MSLRKSLYLLLSTGSTQEDRKSNRHDRFFFDWDVKHQNRTKNCDFKAFFLFHIPRKWILCESNSYILLPPLGNIHHRLKMLMFDIILQFICIYFPLIEHVILSRLL